MASAYGVDAYGRPQANEPEANAPGQSWDPSQGKWVASGGSPTPNDPRTGQPVVGGGQDPYGHNTGDKDYGYPTGQGPQENYGQPAPGGDTTTAKQAPQQSGPSAPQYPAYKPQPIPYRALPVYQAPTLQKYQAPDLSGIDASQRGIIQNILNNPETLNPTAVNALNAQTQSDAANIAGQQEDLARTDAARRGVSDGGTFSNQLASIHQNEGNQMILARRNLAIQKAQQDRADQLGAVGAATDFSNAATSRGQSNFTTGLSGDMSQESLNQAANQSAIQKLLFDNEQDLQGRDENRFGYGTQADAANFANNQYQFKNQLGFNYAQLNAQQQAALIAAILGSR